MEVEMKIKLLILVLWMKKNKILSGTELSYDKYGNKSVIRKKKINGNNNLHQRNNQKLIKMNKKMNKSYDNPS